MINNKLDTSHIFNITEIPRNSERPLILEFYGGDITSIYSDVMLISAFQGDFRPMPNTIFGRIKDKFGVSYSSKLPDEVTDLGEGIYDLHSPQTEAYKRLWALEITNFNTSADRSILFYKSIKHLEKLIDAINYLGIESISIPLLGSGAQGLTREEASMALIGIINKWAQKSTILKTVRVFAYDIKAAATLNQLIDNFFGHGAEDPSSTSFELLQASRLELLEKSDGFHENIRPNMEEIINLLDTPNPSVKSIAVAGRSIAENCSEYLLNIWFPQENATLLNLNARILKIQEELKKETGWMLAYFRLLQSSGNYGAHHSKQTLTIIDAAAIVIGVLRIAEFTTNHINKYLK
jgi:hypothetical protein